jgi:enamine deaminase RidA (YjgF/YER057c/UK114 family)
MSQTRFINPQTLGKPPGYTHVVEVTAPARIVYIAGQLGVGRDGKVVGGDIRAQAVQTFENLKSALAAVGAEFRDVVKFNNYLVDRAHRRPSARCVTATFPQTIARQAPPSRSPGWHGTGRS